MATWKIDPAHSEVNFSVRHMMISNVRGQFEQFTGTVNFNEENPALSSVDVQIDTASISTKEAMRDNHLKSPDFLDVEKYPTMTFKSKYVHPTGKNSGEIVGNLTIRDVTHEVVLDVEYSGQAKSPWGTTSAGFTANAKINRKDFGLTWNQALETGGVLVGDDIKITIELEVVKEEEATTVAGD
jgi:polyisoprenoid-binding protein YceI